MTEQTKTKLIYWAIGLFSGAAVAVPVTAYVTKEIVEKKADTKIVEASDNAYEKGLNDMASYACQQQENKPEVVVETDADFDIDNYDINIDDEEATEEISERAEAHEKYLDMITKYSGDDDSVKPHVIDGDSFAEEQYMEKIYINWYERDNVFEEDLSAWDDPYANVGVVDGHELFKDSYDRPDPDICYVRNERQSTDYEITRIHGAYSEMVGRI